MFSIFLTCFLKSTSSPLQSHNLWSINLKILTVWSTFLHRPQEKKKSSFYKCWDTWWVQQKKYAKQVRFSIQMFLISKCVNISAQMLLGYFQFVCFKESTFIDIITQQNWSNILSVYFSLKVFPIFEKL